MRQVAVFLVALLMIASCKTIEPPTQSCQFKVDSLTKGTNGAAILDDQLDSTRAYTYQYEVVNMDSLVVSLCDRGYEITDGYYVDGYLCDDARGPRPVVVLKQTDDRILSQGFWKGSNGRLACAWKIAHYQPK